VLTVDQREGREVDAEGNRGNGGSGWLASFGNEAASDIRPDIRAYGAGEKTETNPRHLDNGAGLSRGHAATGAAG
jgi:hypothetical protein